jgi:hypothetical protein
MLEETINIINSNGVAFSLVSVFVGLLIGNWLAIGRDKRKEFNNISLDLFTSLSRQLEHGRYITPADTAVCLLIEPHIPIYKRGLFRKCVRSYENAQQGISTYEPATGTVTFDEEKLKHLASCAKKLLSYVKRR